ncbi:ArsB/NhaD family transporter [Nocardioides sp. HDW12B]|uniref:SLC13 family permease n=1 Tax=Nocardioides sp. HDW12B TaxID=2714939 RepID=UPI001407E7BD|nr:ArsB/NhaD family transporter [Nocardioides sp. HDW12B]QIK67966.1 ArsB/NhaD family transporter [Nocardioides sp. HDW12B]
MSATLAVVVFVVTYTLIATERVPRVHAAIGGAAVMAVLGIVDTDTAFYDSDRGIDWNVIALLFGMMLIVGVLRQTGLFGFLAVWCVQVSRGRPFPLMALLIVVTASASALLDNVTTVLLVAPVVLRVCRELDLPSGPYLISVACASNIGGTATLIGDPPNIMIASRTGLTFNDFLANLAPLVVVLVVVYVGLCRVYFRRVLTVSGGGVPVPPPAADPWEQIVDRGLLWRCLAVLVVVIAGFVMHSVVHVQPALVALLGAVAMILVARASTEEVLADVEWETLAFFMALFVLVGGLSGEGVIDAIGSFAVDAADGRWFLAATTLLFGSAVLGAFVDNIPYTAAMIPVVEDLVATDPDAAFPLWWAFALGADLGGNTTAVAAGANVVVTGIAARSGEPISFWQFTKHGLLTTAVTLTIAWVYVGWRYFS